MWQPWRQHASKTKRHSPMHRLCRAAGKAGPVQGSAAHLVPQHVAPVHAVRAVSQVAALLAVAQHVWEGLLIKGRVLLGVEQDAQRPVLVARKNVAMEQVEATQMDLQGVEGWGWGVTECCWCWGACRVWLWYASWRITR